jgi:hypothetical protein
VTVKGWSGTWGRCCCARPPTVGLTAKIARVLGLRRADRLCRAVVQVGAASAIACGRGTCPAERLLAHHTDTFGTCGSDSTLWRVLDFMDEAPLRRTSRALGETRRTVWWLLTGATHETIAHLQSLNHKRRRVTWTFGWTFTKVEENAIAALTEQVRAP